MGKLVRYSKKMRSQMTEAEVMDKVIKAVGTMKLELDAVCAQRDELLEVVKYQSGRPDVDRGFLVDLIEKYEPKKETVQ